MSSTDEVPKPEGNTSANVESVDKVAQVPKSSDDRAMRPSMLGGASSTYPMRAADAANPGGWLAGGWLSMAKIVRDYDEEKVKDCKEDIDTLLVFAGLYSAVLSAFIIESYKLLQQDPKDEMLFYMRHLVAKNYLIGPGFMNATDPSPQPPPFTPPTWAIRVNVLWFASLVLSLSAASFGILVKQWLREFLAMEYTLPQERLRARQYRGEALKAWGVYEIAAALPLLLQIALGLFFVGLCYFTEAIHQSIGHTTLPLVSGWAFFIFLTTIAPLIFPRCPYKTTFLKHITKSLRRHIFRMIKIGSLVIHILFTDTLLLSIHNLLSTVIRQSSLNQIMTGVVEKMKRRVIGRSERQGEHPPGVIRRLSKRYVAVWPQLPEEEEDVLAKDVDDTGILLDVDVIMPSNGFLPMILETYKQQGTLEQQPEKTMVFVLSLIKHRVGPRSQSSYDTEGLLPSTLDLRSLSKLDWNALVDIVTETLETVLADSQEATQFPVWVQNAVIFLLSPSKYPRGGRTTRVIHRCFAAGILAPILGPLLKDRQSDVAASVLQLIELVKICPGQHTDSNLLACTKMLRRLSHGRGEAVDGADALDPTFSLRHLPPATQALLIDATIVILRERKDILSVAKSPDSNVWALNALRLLFSDTSPTVRPPLSAQGIVTYGLQPEAHEGFSLILSIALNCKNDDILSSHTKSSEGIITSTSRVLHYYGMLRTSTDLDLRLLSEKSWNLLSELLGRALNTIKIPKQSGSEQLTAAHDAIAILLSKSKYDLHPNARLALLQLLGQPGFLARLHEHYRSSGLFRNSENVLWYARRILGLYCEIQRERQGERVSIRQVKSIWSTWSRYAVGVLDQLEWGAVPSTGAADAVDRGMDAAFLLLENFQLPLSKQGQHSLKAWVTFVPSYMPDHILVTIPNTVPSMHHHLIKALCGLLSWRLLDRVDVGSSPPLFDLTSLSDDVQAKVIHAAARVLLQHCKPSASIATSGWIEDGILILLSRVTHRLPVSSYAFSAVCQCLEVVAGLPKQLAHRLELDSFPPFSSDFVDLLSDSPHSLAVLRYAVALCRKPSVPTFVDPSVPSPVLDILRGRSASGLDETEYEVLRDLWKVLSPALDGFVFGLGKEVSDFESWSPRMLVVLSLANNPHILPDNTELYDTILSHYHTASLIPFLCATIHWQDGWYGHHEAFIDAFGRCDIAVQTSIVQDICKHLEQALGTAADEPHPRLPSDNWDAVKLCAVCIQLFQTHLTANQTSRGIVDDTDGFQWNTLWKLLAEFGRRYSYRRGYATPYRRKWWHESDEHPPPDEIEALDHIIARDECIARIAEIHRLFPFEFWNALHLFVPVRTPFRDYDGDD